MAACSNTSVGFAPLSEPGVSPYPDTLLGLYPGGSNDVPTEHLAAGVAIASTVVPLKPNGTPGNNGQMGLISLGFSGTSGEWTRLMATPPPNGKLKFVNGASGGLTAEAWQDPAGECWTQLDQRIIAAGLTNAQIVAAWVKLANRVPEGDWPTAMLELQSDIEAVVRILATRFVNLKLAYLSSRIYGGYAETQLNPEPYAYQGGYAVRGVIESQLNGNLPYSGPNRVAPWLSWGPYMWADGTTPRSDGLTWQCEDFREDGTHPSGLGKNKVATMLRDFFMTNPTTGWFVGS